MKTNNQLHLQALSTAKDNMIETMLSVYNKELFGSPPKVSESGKLYGAQPPNMQKLQKILF